jgi:hypothetical protein
VRKRRAGDGLATQDAMKAPHREAAAMQDENSFVIEKILDQHLLYEQKSSDSLTGFVRVVFALNAGAVILMVVFLGAAAVDDAALARFRPDAADALNFFVTGAVFAILSGLFSWWSYGAIAHRKRMMLEEVFLEEDQPGTNRTRSERLIDALLGEGRGSIPAASYLGILTALLAVAAFMLGCQDMVSSLGQ